MKRLHENQKFNELLNSDDAVYHYTTFETFAEYIFPDHRLRLSERKKSSDPLENSMLYATTRSSIYEDRIHEKSRHEFLKINKVCEDRIKKVRQLCLCKNNNSSNCDEINVGYLKSRMWDLYGDRHKGVCLVLSRKELEKNHGCKFLDIEYKCVEDYIGIIDVDLEGDSKQYHDDLYNFLIGSKQKDYIDENEFRVIKENVSAEYEYINIKEALKGVVVGLDHLKSYEEEFLKSDTFKDLEVCRINWLGGFGLTKLEDTEKRYQAIVDENNKIRKETN